MGDLYNKDWRDLKFACFDFETTGLNPKDQRATQLGIVVFQQEDILSSFCEKINPQGKKQEKKAKAKTGFTDDELANARMFTEMSEEVKKILFDCDFWVAYNECFDRAFLLMECKKAGVHMPVKPIIDPLIWAQFFWPGLPNNLDSVSQRIKVVLSSEDREYLSAENVQRHRADYDAMLTARCLYAMGNLMPSTLRQTLYVQEYVYKYWLIRIKGNDKKYARPLTPILPREGYGDEVPAWLEEI